MNIPSFETELARVLRAVDPKVGVLGDDPTTQDETTGIVEQRLPPPVPPPPLKVTPRTLFSHPEAHPIVLDLALLLKYQEAEWLTWEPESTQVHITQDFGPLSDLNFSKVMAMKTLHLVDSFWEQWEVFNWVTAPLNGIFPDFQVMQVPTVAHIMISTFIANRVREDVPWSDELRIFLGKVHEHEGIFLAQPPVEDAIIHTEGTGINFPDVQTRWPAIRVSGRVPTGDTPEDEQLRRMLIVHGALHENMERLRAQLPLVQHA